MNSCFWGFLPRRRKERRERLRTVAPYNFTLVLFEAPHRVQATLRDLLEELGDRKISVCRELTKLYEEVFRGTVSQAVDWVQAPRGEYVLVIQNPQSEQPTEDENLSREDEARRQLVRLREKEIGAKDAVSQVAAAVELPKNRIYRLWLETGSGRRP